MSPSMWPLARVGAVGAVVPVAWQEVQATAWPAVLVWLPVAGPLAVMTLAPVWQAAQPLPVTPQAGVTTKPPTTYGLAWQEAVEQVVPALPLVLFSVA